MQQIRLRRDCRARSSRQAKESRCTSGLAAGVQLGSEPTNCRGSSVVPIRSGHWRPNLVDTGGYRSGCRASVGVRVSGGQGLASRVAPRERLTVADVVRDPATSRFGSRLSSVLRVKDSRRSPAPRHPLVRRGRGSWCIVFRDRRARDFGATAPRSRGRGRSAGTVGAVDLRAAERGECCLA